MKDGAGAIVLPMRSPITPSWGASWSPLPTLRSLQSHALSPAAISRWVQAQVVLQPQVARAAVRVLGVVLVPREARAAAAQARARALAMQGRPVGWRAGQLHPPGGQCRLQDL